MCSIFTKYIVKSETILYNITKCVDEIANVHKVIEKRMMYRNEIIDITQMLMSGKWIQRKAAL